MIKHMPTRRGFMIFVSLILLFSLFSQAVAAAPYNAPPVPVTFTILHTNDFHGQLEASGQQPGMCARCQCGQ